MMTPPSSEPTAEARGRKTSRLCRAQIVRWDARRTSLIRQMTSARSWIRRWSDVTKKPRSRKCLSFSSDGVSYTGPAGTPAARSQAVASSWSLVRVHSATPCSTRPFCSSRPSSVHKLGSSAQGGSPIAFTRARHCSSVRAAITIQEPSSLQGKAPWGQAAASGLP
jgi:hypothetical protein